MKHFLAALLTMVLLPGALEARPAVAASAPTDSLEQMVGLFVAENTRRSIENMANTFAAYGDTLDTERVAELVGRMLERSTSGVSYQEVTTWLSGYMDSKAGILSERLLEGAASIPGARVLPSGLVFQVIEEGSGAQPGANDVVEIRYTAMLPDGMVFDCIEQDEEPMVTRVCDLTPGVAEGLTLMRAGGSYVITMPSDLGYGPEGIPGVIPPDSALRFEIELLGVEK